VSGPWEDYAGSEGAPSPPESGPWNDFAAKPEVTAKDRVLATEGGANAGIAGALGLPVDTAENLINLATAGYGAAKMAITGKPGPAPLSGSVGGSEWIKSLMNKVGITTDNPQPQDLASRMLYTGARVGTGSLGAGGATSNIAAGVGGAVASEVGGPEWTVLGSITPSGALQAARAASATRRTALASTVSGNQDTFAKVGAQPTVAQATQSPFMQGLENLVAKFPGGQGMIDAARKRQQAALGASVNTGVSAEEGGRAITSGATGFLDRTKAQWNALDDAVAAKIPAGSGVAPTNTLVTLDKLTAPTAGAEQTSRVMSTPKVAEIRKAMTSDLAGKPPSNVITLLDQDGKPLSSVPIGGTPGNETMPYQALRELRSKVGSMLDNALVSDIPTGELKLLYGALSKDMEAAANKAGAGQEFARQNTYYAARMQRIESVLDKVIGKDRLPEDVFKSFMPTDPDAANKVRAVMRSLAPDERQVVSQAVVNRLGRATPGKQNDVGDVFSSETFLTNWNRLSPGAKSQLFPDSKMRGDLDALAGVSTNLREGSKVMANPAGTAAANVGYGLIGSAATALATGHPVVAAGVAAAPVGAYIGARMLTSPAIVSWLAKTPDLAPRNMAPHLARLAVIYNESDDATKQELDKFMSSLQSGTQQ
jgi:hypothetical protein